MAPMAVKHYQPQLLHCDFFVDTTNAMLWVPPHMREMLKGIWVSPDHNQILERFSLLKTAARPRLVVFLIFVTNL
jgi:hypothetical protein